jgi:D-alanine-D-alanine ligase
MWWNQQYSFKILSGNKDPAVNMEKHLSPFSYSMIDYWFPLIHGKFGEDGQLQKILIKTELPFIGSDEQASLTCYDKIKSREKAKSADIIQPKYIFFTYTNQKSIERIKNTIIHEIGLPCFIKPSRTGSSLGISRVKEKEEINPALYLALSYDTHILIEKAVENCYEYEIAFIGNKMKRFSIPGSIEYEDIFYTTQAKYSSNTTKLKSVKKLDQRLKNKIYNQTEKIIDIFNVKDLGRVDFLYDQKNDILYWNEINTIPGFTEKSMFPFLWKEMGLDLEDVIDLIIGEYLY